MGDGKNLQWSWLSDNDRLVTSVAKTTALAYCPYYCVNFQRMGLDESDIIPECLVRGTLEVLGWPVFWSDSIKDILGHGDMEAIFSCTGKGWRNRWQQTFGWIPPCRLGGSSCHLASGWKVSLVLRIPPGPCIQARVGPTSPVHLWMTSGNEVRERKKPLLVLPEGLPKALLGSQL